MDKLLQDVRFAVRSSLKSPGFSIVAVLVLALGIGATTTIFGVVNALFFRAPAGVAAPEQLVSLYTSDFSGPRFGASSLPDVAAFRSGAAHLFDGIAAFAPRPARVTSGDVAWGTIAEAVEPGYFSMLRVRPALGRVLAEADAREPVAVIGHTAWQQHFGGAPDVAGRPLRFNGITYTIVGVATPGFTGMTRGVQADVWVPAAVAHPDYAEERGNRGLFVLGRLRDGVDAAEASAALEVVAARLQAEHRDFWTDLNGQRRVVTVLPEHEARVPPQMRGAVIGFMGLLLGVVILVLVVACANVANLLLARAAGRRREIAVRLAIGAARGRIVRQLLTEAGVLALAAGALGLLVAVWGGYALHRVQPLPVRFSLDLSLDAPVLAFATAVSLFTALVFGLAPALQATRPALVSALKDGTLTIGRGRRLTLRNALVAGQVALSLVLLLAAGLMLRTLQAGASANPGFDPSDVVLFDFELDPGSFDGPRTDAFYAQLLERTAALPGVDAVTVANPVPLGSGGGRRWIGVVGYTPREGEDMEFHFTVAGPRYFETMRHPLVRGRDFDARDRTDAPSVVVVNETFARRFWGSTDVIGRQMRLSGEEGPVSEVVGVAGDSKYASFSEEPRPIFYYPFLQRPGYQGSLLVRARRDPAAVIAAVRAIAVDVARDVPLARAVTLREHVGFSLLPQRVLAGVLAGFGALALALASFGLYGVISFAVSQRTREIGIRVALGAAVRDVRTMVVAQGLRLTAAGIALGLALALVATRLLARLLYGVSPTDPLTFAVVPLALLAVAALASYLPARRATRVDPVVALRHD